MTNPDPSRSSWWMRPATARVDDYLAGGDDNYFSDRELAGRLVEAAPWLPDMIRTNRAHGHDVVTTLAKEHGIRQVLALGCGLPPCLHRMEGHRPPTTFESVTDVHKDARVVYADHDPRVFGRARMALAEDTGTAAVHADIRQWDQLLDHPALDLFDRTARILVLVHDLLTWVNLGAADAAMSTLRRRLPAGSAISLTHATTDTDPQAMSALIGHYAKAGIEYRPRSLEQIEALLGPWALLPPGIVSTAQWHSAARDAGQLPPADHSFAYAAVAMKPT
ncbi:SAM-dependent methyltransferase [Streptomyces decoyicus]|uniref:SAM-dependent methyltransferase n=1 Tax=Streptomyces decoyicus TaxID=249567 RepID=UPI00364E7410